jgi:enoyl-CoA hydratase
MTTEPSPAEVFAVIQGRLGIITLDRPKALNALNLGMVEQLDTILAHWAGNPAVDAVLIHSSSERAFCAGGDVRSIGILPSSAERMALGRAFFGTEYRVNYRINTFPKPFIALINGIAMGGGLGVSIHGTHRVVSEDLRMAMPETVLGLFPDVGGSWFLNRCPGAIGRYLALLGPNIGAADALVAGLATHHVPKAHFDALTVDLSEAVSLNEDTIDAIIDGYSVPAEDGTLAQNAEKIEQIFGSDDLETVISAIDAQAHIEPWIAEAQAVLRRASPISLRATWRRMVEGRDQSIEHVLTDDFRMSVRIVGGHDFAEGVRAMLLDKDMSPRWNPATLEAVTDSDIDALLEPIAGEVDLTAETQAEAS